MKPTSRAADFSPWSRSAFTVTLAFMMTLTVDLCSGQGIPFESFGASRRFLQRFPSYRESRCHSSRQSFELITGHVYSASTADTIATLPDTLQLTDCLERCRTEPLCQSVNFETGLCVLFNSSSAGAGSGLTPSQFPVFTIYAQKVCLSIEARRTCNRPWTFERVLGHELRSQSKRTLSLEDRLQCMDACLLETMFNCHSFNFDVGTGQCSLSDMDRHTLSQPGVVGGTKYFRAAQNMSTDYFESNCVQEPNKLCDFKAIKGKVVKTVDSVYQGITTDEECRKKCLEADYRCFSYDLGDPESKVCRTSHLDSSSLTHIEEAYFEAPGSTTFELASCFNVTIECGATGMKTLIKTNRIFNGKVYDKQKPNSCVSDVKNTLTFELSMPYSDISCDVKQTAPGNFANSIVIQHHDLIVTSTDLGLNVQCYYDLSNRTVNNVIIFDEEGERIGDVLHDTPDIVHSTVVAPPNVTIIITDGMGEDVIKARVGDVLTIKFVITDKDSPYGIFVRDLVAMDGSDTGEIVLIDERGCPTDTDILGAINKSSKNPQSLETKFEAFKFPTSNVVQFKAIVTPCVTACQAAVCDESPSYGRRRRRAVAPPVEADNEKVVVVKTLRIEDNFQKDKRSRAAILSDGSDLSNETCYDFKPLATMVSVFLFVQMVIIIAWIWGFVRRDRKLMAYDRRACEQLYSNGSLGSLSSHGPPASIWTSTMSSVDTSGKFGTGHGAYWQGRHS